MGRFALLLLPFTIFISTASATIINVPGDQPTIQAGLNAATEEDTVQVASGTYYENIIWPAVNGIKLIGSGEEDCVIDGDSLGSVISFNWDLGGIIDTTTLINGFTVRNGGYSARGGGICLHTSHPTLLNTTIMDNMASRGGGISCYYSSPNLLSVTLTSNLAGIDGGGIYCEDSSLVLVGCTIADNFADDFGGGLYCTGSGLRLHDVTITGNTAAWYRGGPEKMDTRLSVFL